MAYCNIHVSARALNSVMLFAYMVYTVVIISMYFVYLSVFVVVLLWSCAICWPWQLAFQSIQLHLPIGTSHRSIDWLIGWLVALVHRVLMNIINYNSYNLLFLTTTFSLRVLNQSLAKPHGTSIYLTKFAAGVKLPDPASNERGREGINAEHVLKV